MGKLSTVHTRLENLGTSIMMLTSEHHDKVREHRAKVNKYLALKDTTTSEAELLWADIDLAESPKYAMLLLLERRLLESIDAFATAIKDVETILMKYKVKDEATGEGKQTKVAKKTKAEALVSLASAELAALKDMKRLADQKF